MAPLDSRQRAAYLFLALSLGHIILISMQVSSKSGVPIFEAVVFGIFAEMQRAVGSVTAGGGGVWSGYVALRGVKAENDALKEELAGAKIDLQRERAMAERSRTLEQLLQLRDQSKLATAAATVIAGGATPEFRTITIDKGTDAGLMADMAVIAPGGVVGRIVVPSARASKVQLLIDHNAAAGALIERSRSQGIVTGAGEELLRMGYVSETSDVAVGDTVVTSGIDGIYPKGFVIGRVEAVERSGGAYREIMVRSMVDFSSLEEVLVVMTPPALKELGVEESRP